MSRSNRVLHILVVGFHHKKGGQVEFSYPPLVADGVNECPIGWKYLPTLALPDGSHNYEEDSVFFNLPSLDEQNESVFGVSCFRQIPVEVCYRYSITHQSKQILIVFSLLCRSN